MGSGPKGEVAMSNVIRLRPRIIIKYEPGKHYVFPKPINARCTIFFGSIPWKNKTFSEGDCLMYADRKDRRFFFFVGVPTGEEEEHYFVLPAE